ncbi:hypothetical protein PR048_016724 [Dryococelus australis]|uniref:Uncharacterized protein n=1 Tax=Dryococelus australis TaxID=614101 RepID=A0ABQ9H7K3_9NEOP|nr:hypothetical protein PR048_016724 [Dryococelus australis]
MNFILRVIRVIRRRTGPLRSAVPTYVKRSNGGWAKGNRHMTFAVLMYSDLSYDTRSVPHNKDLPVPKPPAHVSVEDVCEYESDVEMRQVVEDTTFDTSTSSSELGELLRDLNLSKNAAEFLASRLKEVTLVYCNALCALMEELNHEQVASEWRLFIDSSETSLEAVL